VTTTPTTTPTERAAPAARSPSRRTPGGVRRRFALATFAGESLGFAAPALVGAAAVALDAPAAATVPLAALAGTAEGAVLGVAQGRAFRHELPGFPVGAYTAATAGAAAAAWTGGMSLGAWGGSLPTPVLAGAAAVVAPSILLSIGTGQWLVLRHHVERAHGWIPANAAAWLLGLPAPFVAMAALSDDASAPVRAAAGVLSGLAMAGIVAAVLGTAAARLVARPRRFISSG
jgi:hypothetical protein